MSGVKYNTPYGIKKASRSKRKIKETSSDQ
jgi:hypothetical protein